MMTLSAATVGLRHQLHNSVRTLDGLFQLAWTCPRYYRPGYGLRPLYAWGSSHYPHPNLGGPKSKTQVAHKFLQSKRESGNLSRFHSARPTRLQSLSAHAYDDSSKSNRSSESSSESSENKKATGGFFSKLLKNLLKAFGALLLAAILAAAALPSLLSWVPGRNAAISLANKMIPGTVNVSSMSLGWTKPLVVEGLTLQGTDGENVLLIPKVETKASLWSIVAGKSGLGDCTVDSPVIDLQQHPKNNLPRLALAVAPAEKLLQNSKRLKKPQKHVEVPAAEASLTVQVKAPNGDFQVNNGKVIFPSDAGSLLGDKLVVDVALGPWATKESEELKDAEDENDGLPLIASLWSKTVQAEALGFLQHKKSKLKLIKPLQAEMDLTPAVAKFYLARVNPLLGEIVGPAIQDEDMPDVIVRVTPTALELPADHFKVNIAPMKVTLARGQVMDGILSLFSKQQLLKGRRDLTMQTAAIEANVSMPSTVECSRLDVLIADKVHVATWGSLDWINENVQMTLAIPGKSLRELLGLTNVPANYYLKVPVGGTLDKPLVDWRKAGVGIAELTARQQGGQFMQGILNIFDSNDKSKVAAPEPIAKLPWEENVA